MGSPSRTTKLIRRMATELSPFDPRVACTWKHLRPCRCRAGLLRTQQAPRCPATTRRGMKRKRNRGTLTALSLYTRSPSQRKQRQVQSSLRRLRKNPRLRIGILIVCAAEGPTIGACSFIICSWRLLVSCRHGTRPEAARRDAGLDAPGRERDRAKGVGRTRHSARASDRHSRRNESTLIVADEITRRCSSSPVAQRAAEVRVVALPGPPRRKSSRLGDRSMSRLRNLPTDAARPRA